MKIKTPDYVISEYGCPKLDSASTISANYNNNNHSCKTNNSCQKLIVQRSACCNGICGNNNNNNNSMSNNTCKLAKLLTDKSRKLLPLRETLTEYYTRLLHVNNNNNNNCKNNSNNNVRDYQFTSSTCSTTSSSYRVFSVQQQKQHKNKQNEYIKQQQKYHQQPYQKCDTFQNNNNKNSINKHRNVTPTPKFYKKYNQRPTLDVINTMGSTDSDLDVF